jgi:RimJ/RimL family protein N-acetyltransferase
VITLFANQGLDWARARIPKLEAWMGEAKSLAAMEDGRILGVVVFDAFTPYDVNMHIVIEDRRCVTRRILKEVFSYPFKQLGLRRVTGLVPASNVPALAFDLRLGFRHEGRKLHGAGDEDEIVLGMTRESCRWIV